MSGGAEDRMVRPACGPMRPGDSRKLRGDVLTFDPGTWYTHGVSSGGFDVSTWGDVFLGRER